ncbi:EF-hand domain-containing protein [Bremerella cremea]|uniref:EF-hand domain-containing protein n=1 Tax=Bremerella cremea TaxID=1031537 RepID=UPI0031EDE790
MKKIWKHSLVVLSLTMVGAAFATANAQGREGGGPRGPREGQRGGGERQFNPEVMIERIMGLDKDGDGKITKEEAGESRAAGMIERADADKDGAVTKEELTKMFERGPGDRQGPPRGEGDRPQMRRGEGDRPGPQRDGERGPRGPRDGDRPEGDRPEGARGPREGGRPGPGGPGQRGGARPEGPTRGGFDGASMGPGMLPGFVMNRLDLSDEQKRELRALQEEMQKKFQSILTEEQRDKLKDMARNRPDFQGPRGEGDRPEGRPQLRGPRDGDRPEFRGPRDGERGPRGPRDGDRREREDEEKDDA